MLQLLTNNKVIMSSSYQDTSINELITSLEGDYISTKTLSVDLLVQILKKQQRTIKEQKNLIESLWVWAEEMDDIVGV